MIELKFYFKLGKELEMAVDEDGNYGEVYSCCTLTVEKPPTEEQMKRLEEGYRKAIAGQVKAELKYITSISKEEYEENVEED